MPAWPPSPDVPQTAGPQGDRRPSRPGHTCRVCPVFVTVLCRRPGARPVCLPRLCLSGRERPFPVTLSPPPSAAQLRWSLPVSASPRGLQCARRADPSPLSHGRSAGGGAGGSPWQPCLGPCIAAVVRVLCTRAHACRTCRCHSCLEQTHLCGRSGTRSTSYILPSLLPSLTLFCFFTWV